MVTQIISYQKLCEHHFYSMRWCWETNSFSRLHACMQKKKKKKKKEQRKREEEKRNGKTKQVCSPELTCDGAPAAVSTQKPVSSCRGRKQQHADSMNEPTAQRAARWGPGRKAPLHSALLGHAPASHLFVSPSFFASVLSSVLPSLSLLRARVCLIASACPLSLPLDSTGPAGLSSP